MNRVLLQGRADGAGKMEQGVNGRRREKVGNRFEHLLAPPHSRQPIVGESGPWCRWGTHERSLAPEVILPFLLSRRRALL